MEEETITQILIIEHGKMRELLARFIRAVERDEREAKQTLRVFENKEKTHVQIEEKELFNLKDASKIPVVETLILQHQSLHERVIQIQDILKDKKDPRELALELQELLRKHTDLEETNFYKILDDELDEKTKDELIPKIKRLFGRELY